MKLSTKVAYNTIIQIISKIIATVLGLFSIRLMADYLGTEGFGQYTTVITFLSFFAILGDLGLTLITAQLISQKNANEEKILNNLFTLRLVSALIFLGLGPLTVFFFPYGDAITTGVMIAALSYVFIALNQVFTGLFQKHLRMDKVSIAEVAGRVILLAGIFLVYRMDYGLNGILLATVIASAINFLIHFYFSRGLARFRFEIDRAVWKEILIKSWPLALTITFNLLYLKTDTIILSLVKSLDEVGVYGAAYKVIEVLVTLPFLFSGIILPILVLARSDNDKDKFGRVMQKSINVMAIFTFPMVFGTWLVSSDVMVLIASREFLASGPILNILIIAAGAIFLGNVFSHAVIAVDRQKKMIPAYIFTAITSIIGYLIFIPRYSYIGAAWVTVYSEIVIGIFSIYMVYKFSRFFPSLKVAAKAALAAFLMFIALYQFPGLNPGLKVASGALVYFILLFLFGGVTREDLSVFYSKELPTPITKDIN